MKDNKKIIAYFLLGFYCSSFFLPSLKICSEGSGCKDYLGSEAFFYCLNSSWFFFGIMSILSIGNIFMILTAISIFLKKQFPGNFIKIGLSIQCLLFLTTLWVGKFIGYYLWIGSQIGMCIFLWFTRKDTLAPKVV